MFMYLLSLSLTLPMPGSVKNEKSCVATASANLKRKYLAERARLFLIGGKWHLPAINLTNNFAANLDKATNHPNRAESNFSCFRLWKRTCLP